MVWVRGDHEYATRAHLSASIAQAVEVEDADVIVDLSGVTFMDASTIGSIVEAYKGARARSRALVARAPSRLARRLLDLCGLAFLIEEPVAPPPMATALDSWVAVPAADRSSDSTSPTPVTEPAPAEESVHAPASRCVAATGSAQHRRTPS